MKSQVKAALGQYLSSAQVKEAKTCKSDIPVIERRREVKSVSLASSW